jgi:2,3-bisphosphoglycerate-dependent phosphoglycerate mutase
MKTFYLLLIFLFVFTASFTKAEAQKKSRVTTVILLRHAEKQIIEGNDNPPLSPAGIERSQRLQSTFPNVVPDIFYSTPFIRTQETLKPWATALNKEIKTYDSGKLLEFSEELLKQQGKTIVVVGHSNTIPQLVNLLIHNEKYRQLPDDEYGTIYIVTIKRGNGKEKIIKY